MCQCVRLSTHINLALSLPVAKHCICLLHTRSIFILSTSQNRHSSLQESPITSTKMPFGSDVIFDRMSIIGTIISITAVGPRHVCQPHVFVGLIVGTPSGRTPPTYFSACGRVLPNESPHTTEAEPEVCFIDTEACQARNLNSSHTWMGEHLYLVRWSFLRNKISHNSISFPK